MFMGEFHPTLDEKCRVAIPIKLRKAFGDTTIINRLIITHGFDKCIMAFRDSDWKEFVEKKLITLSQWEPKNRIRIRFLLGGATECELDKQGRIILPLYLQKHAQIEKDVTILGLYNRIELWNSKIYSKYKPDSEALNDLAEDLGF